MTEIDTSVFTPVYSDLEWDDFDSFTMGYRGVLQDPHCSDDAPFAFEVPVTVWGDYVGDTVTRSNWRALLNDSPLVFKSVDGGYDSHYLIIRAEDLLADDGRWLNELTALREQYPLWDEQDHSALEMEIEAECWESYQAHDLKREIDSVFGAASDGELGLEDVAPELDDESMSGHLRDLFMVEMEDSGEYPVCEDAVSCYWPRSTAAAVRIAERALDEWLADYARDLAAWRASAVSADQGVLL